MRETTPRQAVRCADGPIRHLVPDPSVAVAIVRLLGVALAITIRRTGHEASVPAALPHGYREWPSVNTDIDAAGGRQRQIAYVCPKALPTTDEACFPVGTVLVLERFAPSRGRAKNRSFAHAADAISSIFVLEKYGEIHAGASIHGAWAYAVYRPDGSRVSSGAMRADACAYGVPHPPKGSADGFLPA
jgi:hypothetical protein